MGNLIASTANLRVRSVRALREATERRARGEFLVEGVRLVEEALAAGIEPRTIIIAPSLLARTPRGEALLARVGEGAIRVAEHVLAQAADTESPQGILAVLPLPAPWVAVPDGFLLVLDGVHDPGNAGTILRAAAASGVVTAVAAIGGADPFAPKVLRAGMGAHFRLPLVRLSWPELTPGLGTRRLALAELATGRTVWATNWAKIEGLIVSGETTGPSEAARRVAGAAVHVPMRPGIESLNVSVAAGIMLYEAARQCGALLA